MEVAVKRWRRAEYERLVELGALVDQPIELIGGQLVVAEPKGSYHTSIVVKVDYAIRSVLPPGFIVRVQAPVALDDDSEPEPDIAVVAGSPGDHADAHPQRPALVVEVSDSRLTFDRTHKASLYARGGVADYWIVNLVDRALEVHREPVRDASAPYGWRYRSVQTLGRQATAALLAVPSARIAVGDLLP